MPILVNFEKLKGVRSSQHALLNGGPISGEHWRVIAHLRSPNQLSLVFWEVGVGLKGKSIDIRAHPGV